MLKCVVFTPLLIKISKCNKTKPQAKNSSITVDGGNFGQGPEKEKTSWWSWLYNYLFEDDSNGSWNSPDRKYGNTHLSGENKRIIFYKKNGIVRPKRSKKY
jgi:hypothetical protein